LFPLPVHAARPQLRLLSFPTRRSSDLPAAWSADHDPDTTSRSAGCHAVPDSVRVSIKGLLCTAAVLVAASVTLTGCALFSSEPVDRKSTRLNSSHVKISYAVFCSKKKR